ncbi:MAG: BatD family protein, partial [Phycisphaerales bacterium]|nr:BatD family protein [Phycisphaerales bacterium]
DITATSVAIPELFDAVVEAEDAEVYLGEPIDLTLRVFIRPYYDSRHDITMSANDMFGQVLAQASNWGVFREDLFEKRQLQSREVEHRLADGTVETMYEYQIGARIWPTETGDFQPGRVAVVMRYPQQLQERILSRSSKSYFVSNSAIVSAVPELPRITVKPLPTVGRPDSFNGAVGRFRIESEAQPLNVAVGDPITLRVTLIDQSARGTRLDGVRVPPLHQQTTLTDDFRVPEEQLPGEQIGRRKSFVQTIRPRRADLDRIPPISLSYFNAETGRYETAFSDPIPITVRESASVGMSEIVAAQPGESATSMELTKVAGGLVANYTGDEVLAVEARETSTVASAAVVVLPPALCAAALLVRRRRDRLRTDHTFARRKMAKTRATEHLQAITASSSTSDAAEAVLRAVTGFMADRLGRSGDAMTSREARAELESVGVDETLRMRVDALLQSCEAARYAGAAGEAPRLRDEARSVIEELERSGALS